MLSVDVTVESAPDAGGLLIRASALLAIGSSPVASSETDVVSVIRPLPPEARSPSDHTRRWPSTVLGTGSAETYSRSEGSSSSISKATAAPAPLFS